jgi:hypothetical protein
MSFEPMGPLQCPEAAGAPSEFALDPQGLGHVLFVSGSDVYTVDPKTSACERTGTYRNATWDIAVSSIAYSQAAPGAAVLGALLVQTSTGSTWLASLGAADLAPTPSAALEATAPARFGFLSSGPAGHWYTIESGSGPSTLVELDGAGHPAPRWPIPLPDVGSTFAFWNGDFYFFPLAAVPPGLAAATDVYRLRPADGSCKRIAQSSGRVLLAATVPSP